MRILINASNLKKGGGLQVADSICRQLERFSQHRFFVVLSTYFSDTKDAIESYDNVKVYIYDIHGGFLTTFFGYDHFLNNLVKDNDIDAVLTIFGPSRWIPKVPHLCGFARAQLVILESPFYQMMNKASRIKQRFHYFGMKLMS